jgi:hypothetical protein
MNNITEIQKAYIAGFFDGEGSIGVYFNKSSRKNNPKKYAKLLIRMSQNDRRVLDWIQEIIGCGSVHAKKKKPDRALQHDLVLSHEQARLLINEIKPYLKVKMEQVEKSLLLDSKNIKRRAKE